MHLISTASDSFRPFRSLVSLACALLIAGCADGRLSPMTVSSADTLLPSGQETDSCFAANGKARPGPGDRVKLTLWSAGVQDKDTLNTYPPLSAEIDLRLRELGDDGHLDAVEQRVLATFLQVNRGPDWTESAPHPPAGVHYEDRQKLTTALEANQGRLWNAFVRGLCLRSVPTRPEVKDASGAVRRVFVLEASMPALCKTLPTDAQRLFAPAFLGRPACDGAPSAREPFTVVGLQKDAARGGWASAALAANVAIETDYYYGQRWDLGSPMAVLGVVQFNAVRPFGFDPPDWSLAEWEKAGICGSNLKIRFLRLRDGGVLFQVRDGAKYPTSDDVGQTGTDRYLILKHERNLEQIFGLNRSLPVSALDHLSARDVDELLWASDRANSSAIERPEGCVSRERS